MAAQGKCCKASLQQDPAYEPAHPHRGWRNLPVGVPGQDTTQPGPAGLGEREDLRTFLGDQQRVLELRRP
jgi:hypothetical protein